MEFPSLENLNAKDIYFLGLLWGLGGNYIGESEPWVIILAPRLLVGLTLCEKSLKLFKPQVCLLQNGNDNSTDLTKYLYGLRYFFCLVLFSRLGFKAMEVHSKTEQKVQSFPIYPLPPPCTGGAITIPTITTRDTHFHSQ